MDFCRANGLPASGGKIDIAQRITTYFENGKIILPKPSSVKETNIGSITEDLQIEPNFVCNERGRDI